MKKGLLSVIPSALSVILGISEGSIVSKSFVVAFTPSIAEGLLRMTIPAVTLSRAKSLIDDSLLERVLYTVKGVRIT